MKKTTRALVLARQTIRSLGSDIAHVRGGDPSRINNNVCTEMPTIPLSPLYCVDDPRRAGSTHPRAPRENGN